jgi:indolepyruvate ferredoxin oxidoreductase alpha subunit
MPKEHEKNLKIFKEEIDYNGVSVIIPRRECVVTASKRLRELKKIKEKEAVAG